MNVPFARRVTLAVAALAVSTAVLVAPSNAAAASVPAQQVATEDVQVRGIQPDLEVIPLQMVPVSGKVWYMWKVNNIGAGTAKGIQVTTFAKVWGWYTGNSNPDIGDTYMHHSEVKVGESFFITLECPGIDYSTYCASAHAKVKVTQGIAESIVWNNGYPQGSTKDFQVTH